jgi:hypothetical protein
MVVFSCHNGFRELWFLNARSVWLESPQDPVQVQPEQVRFYFAIKRVLPTFSVQSLRHYRCAHQPSSVHHSVMPGLSFWDEIRLE